MRKCVLFFDVGNPAYIPLIKAVGERGFTLIMNGTGLREQLQSSGLSILPFEGFVPAEIQPRVTATVRQIGEQLAKALEGPNIKGVFLSPIGDFLGYTGQAFFDQLFSLLGAEIWSIETFESLISQCHVSLVVMGCDNSPAQRALVKAAAGFKIPTLQLAHGIPGELNDGVAGEMSDLYSDFVAAFGQIHQTRLVENNISRERVFLTGSPLWDPLYTQEASISQEQARRLLNLDPNRPVVLFCTSYADGSSPYFPGMCRGLFDLHQAVLQAVCQVGPDVQLIVRPHPNELGRAKSSEKEISWLDQAYGDWSSKRHHLTVRLIRDNKIESIRAADLVMTGPSNLVYEAMILQRPVMVVPRLSEGEDTTIAEDQGVRVVRDQTQIPYVLKELLESPSVREEIVKRQNVALPEINHGHDGRATDRVAALVEKLATIPSTASSQPTVPSKETKALRILLAVHMFPPDSWSGTELYTYHLAKVLRKRGHEVTIFYPVTNGASEKPRDLVFSNYEELPIVKLPISQTQCDAVRNEESKPAIRKYFLEHTFDVVHIQHLMGLSISFVEVLEELKIPMILTANDFWFLCEQVHLVEPGGTVCTGPETIDKCVKCFNSRYGPFSEDRIPNLFYFMADRLYACRQTLGKIDLVLCPSEFMLRMFKAYKGEGKRMMHAPQGAALFTPRQTPNQSPIPIVLSYLGNIAFRKGLDILIEAFNRVDASNVELRVYGSIVEHEYFGQVMKKVKKGKKVIFYGAYMPEDLARILSETHVAIVPSRGENYPFVIREILHGGVPVIASSVAGIPEIVRDGENGLLFQGGSVSDLSQKLERVIKTPDLIDELKRGIQSIKSIEQETVELESHYASVLSLNPRSSTSPETIDIRECDQKNTAPKDEGKDGEEKTASIIIPVFNKVELTQQCLLNLAQVTQGVTYEVIIVDNASTDETHQFLSSLEGDVQIIQNRENFGFAKGCNQGAQAAKGKYLVFLNNDTIPKPGWLDALIQEAETHVDVAVVGSKLLYPDETIQHAGVVFSRDLFTPYHIYSRFPQNSPAVNRRRQFKAVTAACMLVKRSFFEAVGGYDEGYRNGFEDIDLCLKIGTQGGKVIYQPASVLYHLESQTEGRHDHNNSNIKRFLHRWRDLWLEDEDAKVFEDGYVIRIKNDAERGTRQLFEKPSSNEECGRWDKVAEAQRILNQVGTRTTRDEQQALLIEQVREILRRSEEWPEDASVASWAGWLCQILQMPSQAEAFWRKVLVLRNDPDARAGLARLALEKGDLLEAEEQVRKIIANDPLHPEGELLRGVLEMQRQQYAEAYQAFEAALKTKGDKRKAQMGLGMAAFGLRKGKQAWEMFIKVLDSYPDDQEALHWLLRAGTLLERWDDLVSRLTFYLDRNPADLSARYALAGLQLRRGAIDEAQSHCNTLQMLNPDFEGLKDLAAALQVQKNPPVEQLALGS